MPRKKAVKDEDTIVASAAQIDETNDMTISEPENVSGNIPIQEPPQTDEAQKENPTQEIPPTENPPMVNETPEHRELKLGVLKVNLDEEESHDDEFETQWNEIVTFYRTRRIVPVTITGIEKTQLAGNVVVAYYKNQRIIIPMTEMLIVLSDENDMGYSLLERLERISTTMLGAEIDVIIKGVDKKSESVVASRRDAMLRKREKFYLTPLSDGLPHVREGRIVEARIIGVTQLVARIEVFGVETTLGASELSWDWLPNVSDRFSVGDKLNVLIKEIRGDNVDNLKIVADAKSITTNTSMENLGKCTVQNRYVGVITNVRNGVAYVRLKVGVNAIAHTNYDRRTPAKGDTVSFVITRINPEYGNVAGIITKIIKQSV